jgi:capsular polysaccharide biosynthesis protein
MLLTVQETFQTSTQIIIKNKKQEIQNVRTNPVNNPNNSVSVLGGVESTVREFNSVTENRFCV